MFLKPYLPQSFLENFKLHFNKSQKPAELINTKPHHITKKSKSNHSIAPTTKQKNIKHKINKIRKWRVNKIRAIVRIHECCSRRDRVYNAVQSKSKATHEGKGTCVLYAITTKSDFSLANSNSKSVCYRSFLSKQ